MEVFRICFLSEKSPGTLCKLLIVIPHVDPALYYHAQTLIIRGRGDLSMILHEHHLGHIDQPIGITQSLSHTQWLFAFLAAYRP